MVNPQIIIKSAFKYYTNPIIVSVNYMYVATYHVFT